MLFYQWPFIITDATPFSFYYNQMQFQLVYALLVECKCTFILYCIAIATYIYQFIFHNSPFSLSLCFIFLKCLVSGDTHYLHTYCTTVLINQYLLETRMRYFKIVLSRQEIVFPCVHSLLHSMLKYFQTQHFPRTLCPLP